MAQGRALIVIVAGGLALGGCDEPNDWPTPPRLPGATATATAPVALAEPSVAAACPDPLTGLWVARRFDGVKWYEHRLQFERQGGRLTCAQDSRSWFGADTDVAPPQVWRSDSTVAVRTSRPAAVTAASQRRSVTPSAGPPRGQGGGRSASAGASHQRVSCAHTSWPPWRSSSIRNSFQ